MKPARPSNGYPFVTQQIVLERLQHDSSFVREALEILHRRYAQRDLLPPPAGWMASHRKAGEAAYAALSSPDCTDDDVARAAALAKRYAKQITKVLRDDQIARDPRLCLAAAVFGVRPSEELDDGDDPYAETEKNGEVDDVSIYPAQVVPKVIDDRVPPPPRVDGPAESRVAPETKPQAPSTAIPKKRGRPPGSKNRAAPKDAPMTTRRRR